MRRLGGALAAAIAVGGCQDDGEAARLRVSAASSLTEAFTDAARAFEAERPGVEVDLAFAGSQVLRVQIEAGAPVDVFASANPEHMRALEAGGLVDAPVPLAENHLVLAVPADNPAGLEGLRDLPKAERVVLGTEAVPVGRYARRALAAAEAAWGAEFAAKVRARVVSEESNVRQVRAKLELGEADAALIYRTDALASDRVKAIPLEGARDVHVEYLVARTARADPPEVAQAFLDFLASERARRVLEARGFEGAR